MPSELSDTERVILVEFIPQCNKPTQYNTPKNCNDCMRQSARGDTLPSVARYDFLSDSREILGHTSHTVTTAPSTSFANDYSVSILSFDNM
jgi:hypothetical protein